MTINIFPGIGGQFGIEGRGYLLTKTGSSSRLPKLKRSCLLSFESADARMIPGRQPTTGRRRTNCMQNTTLNRVENPGRRSNGASRLVPVEAPQQSLIEALHTTGRSLRADHERLELTKSHELAIESYLEKIEAELDVIDDLLSFQKPSTLRECVILLYAADNHLDMTINGSAENEDREVRYRTAQKAERILNSIRRRLMEIEGLKPEDLGFFPESYPADAMEIKQAATQQAGLPPPCDRIPRAYRICHLPSGRAFSQ
ncbi:MAG: hypothetical protein ACLPKH_11370 [Rhodomicrobium sp.]